MSAATAATATAEMSDETTATAPAAIRVIANHRAPPDGIFSLLPLVRPMA